MTDNPQPQTATDTAAQEVAEQAHPWADLPPEHFRLLRLAALPTDRHTGARPLRFIQLGRVERLGKQQSLLRLTLQLPGQRVRKEQNILEVWADHEQRTVRFGPDTGLLVQPENRGLGRFMLAQGIIWARQHFAHYQVENTQLASKDAFSDEARARRDHCLQAQGFVVEYLDPLKIKAQCGAPRVSSLHGDWHTEKVQIVELLDAASMLQQADQSLREQDVKVRKLEERIEVFKREDGGLRFTITCLVAFCVFQAGLLIWIATR
ncbi:hypothetical protein [Pseudomonas anguilliseptica]|uniref:Uncharacterized protein n=1 Tax=Pseudomonas anguilliseptica TaxID=53406 RepID=A0A1H5ES33_PSEAG|nr:hypothetical protein [Pseudomonas anguilliseptica]SED93768.1 hypothetical protein SAMN05421553_3680 [Pseudomonas anguilliseptica]